MKLAMNFNTSRQMHDLPATAPASYARNGTRISSLFPRSCRKYVEDIWKIKKKTSKTWSLRSLCSPNEGIRSKKIVAKMSFKIVHLIPTQSTSASHQLSLSCFSRYHFTANNTDPTPGIENGEDASPSCAKHIRSDERTRKDGAICGLVQD